VLLAGLGLARSAFAQTPGDSSETEVTTVESICVGKGDALVAIQAAMALGDRSGITDDEFAEIAEAINESINQDIEENWDEASESARYVIELLGELTGRANDSENGQVAALLREATIAFFGCLRGPQPLPSPDVEGLAEDGTDIEPHPDVDAVLGLVYSAKFTCGKLTHREQQANKRLGDQAYLFEGQDFETEISVHNYSFQPITVWGHAVSANVIGGNDSRAGRRIKHKIAPNSALSVRCDQIARFLNHGQPSPDPTPHEVCQGKAGTQDILRGAMAIMTDALTAATSTDAVISVGQLERIIDALQEAIELEERGKLKQAMELERNIAQRLNRMTGIADERDNERLAELLASATETLTHCIRVLLADIERLANLDAAQLRSDRDQGPRVRSGFLVIETTRELEVTASYIAKSSSSNAGGGSGSGISMDVVQVEPHELVRPRPNDEVLDDEPDEDEEVDDQNDDDQGVDEAVTPELLNAPVIANFL